jgi:hypothetical protein
VRNTHAAEGLIGSLDTTPWFQVLGIGLFLVVVSAGFLYVSGRVQSVTNSADRCLTILFGMLGFVFGATGIVCVCLGLFGWF